MINSTKLLSEEFSPPMKFDFPPLKQGEYIEKYIICKLKSIENL